MTTTVTEQEILDNVKEFNKLLSNDKAFDYLATLRGRWEDEREYEDFEDYRKAIKNSLEKIGVKTLKINKDFKIIALYKSLQIELKVNLTCIKYRYKRGN